MRVRCLCLVLLLTAALPVLAIDRPAKLDNRVKKMVQGLVDASARKDAPGVDQVIAELKGEKASCVLLADAFGAPEQPQQVQLDLARALVELKCPDVRPIALKVLGNPDLENRGDFAVVFARTKDRELTASIVALAGSTRPYDKEMACEALQFMGDASATAALVKATGDSFFSVRQRAAGALASFPSPEAREALCKLATGDSNVGVQQKAMESLGTLGDIQAVPCLVEVLRERPGAATIAAHAALQKVTQIDLGADASAWDQWWEQYKKD
ncbi:MAG: hypothetical protein FJ109_18470, partial [Deltaproteobacteria bacterium]|nr:hypothetical protein [Deltaproteobacteria bacterium]